MEYAISKTDTGDGRLANGIYENSDGAWLAEASVSVGYGRIEYLPLTDEDGDYIPAPSNWRDLVIEQVH